MGKLRSLRRQIERDPEAWISRTSWDERWHPERPAVARYAVGGWKKNRHGFRPSFWSRERSFGGMRKNPYPYQRFVSRVLKDLGHDVY